MPRSQTRPDSIGKVQAQPQAQAQTQAQTLTRDEALEALRQVYKEGLRELAHYEKGLAEFGEYVFGLIPAAHHKIWVSLLEEIRFKRVIIIAPPGHAKSTWCSIIYPAWRIGRDPAIHYLGTSITATQANLFSVAIRDTIKNNGRFGHIFSSVGPDREKGWGESEWFVTPRDVSDPHATYAASGVGGAVIGRRADEIGLDDPYDEKTCATQLQREKVLLWLKRTLRSRLVPNGRFRAVLTRWHYDDFVEAFKDRPSYSVVKMVALSEGKEVFAEARFASSAVEVAEEVFKERLIWNDKDERRARIFVHDRGPALWPEYWSEAALLEEREDIGIPIFNCMYQGDPSALSGDLFSIDSFQKFRREPKLIAVAQFWDTALSEKESASFTVGGTGGIDEEGNIYILKIRRGHYSSLEQANIIGRAWCEDRMEWPLLSQIGVEHGLLSFRLILELKEGGLPIVESLPKGDKVARVRPVSAKGEAGKLFVKESAPWTSALIEEAISFPRGKYDDQIDVMSGLYSLLFGSEKRWKDIPFTVIDLGADTWRQIERLKVL